MKILKTALIIVLVGILIYLIIALLTPPVSQKTTIELDQSSEKIFSTLSDQSQMTNWIPALQVVNQVSGKPNTVGSISEFIFETNGQKIPVLVTINDYKENESMNLTLIHDKIASDVFIKFIPTQSGSKLDISYVIKGNSLMTIFAMPLIKPLIKQYSEMDAEELKKLFDKS
jgi:hypothetical protein